MAPTFQRELNMPRSRMSKRAPGPQGLGADGPGQRGTFTEGSSHTPQTDGW